MLGAAMLYWLCLISLELLATGSYRFALNVNGKRVVVTIDQNEPRLVSLVTRETSHTNRGEK